jgi:hypothetical protein
VDQRSPTPAVFIFSGSYSLRALPSAKVRQHLLYIIFFAKEAAVDDKSHSMVKNFKQPDGKQSANHRRKCARGYPEN